METYRALGGRITLICLHVGARAFVDWMADLRMRRQQRLGEECFQGLTAVLAESVIRTLVGGRDLMREQLRNLIEVTQQHPVTIHVLPFSAGALPGTGNFIIFGFPDDLDGEVVYVDSRLHRWRQERRLRPPPRLVEPVPSAPRPSRDTPILRSG